MEIPHVGELAALGTACCWACSALAFEGAGKRIGSLSLNFVRLVMALGILLLFLPLTGRSVDPTQLPHDQALLLGLSGLVGFVFGDWCLFKALVLIGSRTALLIMALVPPLTAILGLIFLREGMPRFGVLGMILTVSGVAWVVLERQKPVLGQTSGAPSSSKALGVLLSLGGALGQAIGLLLSRRAMTGLDPFEASELRILAGIAGFVLVLTASRWWSRLWKALHDRRAMLLSLIGAFFGPFLGVSLSLAAVRSTDTGTAATLMSIVPVLLIPPAVWIMKEKVSARSVVGAVLAVVGVGLMFLGEHP